MEIQGFLQCLQKKEAQSLAVCSQQGVFLVFHLIFPSRSCHNPRECCSPPGPTSCSSLRRKDEWVWGHGTPQLSVGLQSPVNLLDGWNWAVNSASSLQCCSTHLSTGSLAGASGYHWNVPAQHSSGSFQLHSKSPSRLTPGSFMIPLFVEILPFESLNSVQLNYSTFQ